MQNELEKQKDLGVRERRRERREKIFDWACWVVWPVALLAIVGGAIRFWPESSEGQFFAEVALVIVLWIEGGVALLHFRQDATDEEERRRLDLFLDLNRLVLELRNSKDSVEIRGQIVNLGKEPDETVRLAKLKGMGEPLLVYLNAMNTLCWRILKCPPKVQEEVTDVFRVHIKNEWKSLWPYIRELRDTYESEEKWWLMHHFGTLVETLRNSNGDRDLVTQAPEDGGKQVGRI